MALPRPLAPPTGISAAAKRALMGPGGAGTGRGLPAPTAEVCQINSSPRNCPGRSGGEEGSETRRPTAHPRQGASSARGKAAQRPKRGELRGAARSCGTGPRGRRMPPRVKPPPSAPKESLNFCHGALAPQPGRAHAAVRVERQGLGHWGRTKGTGAGAPQDRGAPHRGAPPGGPARTPPPELAGPDTSAAI